MKSITSLLLIVAIITSILFVVAFVIIHRDQEKWEPVMQRGPTDSSVVFIIPTGTVIGGFSTKMEGIYLDRDSYDDLVSKIEIARESSSLFFRAFRQSLPRGK